MRKKRALAEAKASRTCQNLPESLAVVFGRLAVPEVQKLRLVCKDWRRAVSDAFTGKLQPNQLATAMVAFPNATVLSCKAPQNKLRPEDFHCMGQLKQLTSLELYDDDSLEGGYSLRLSQNLRELAILPSLTRLKLEGFTNLRDEHLHAVARELSRLMELDVSACYELTSRGLACLSSLNNLKALNLTRCIIIDDKGLERLRHCTSLQTLNISWNPVKGSFLSTLTSLRILAARNCGVEEDAGSPTSFDSAVYAVLFGDCNNALADLTNLTALDIGWNDVTAGALEGIAQNLPLKQLVLEMCCLDWTDWSYLNPPHGAARGSMATIGTITTLEKLCLKNSCVVGKEAAKLMALSRLTDLDLSHCNDHVDKEDGITKGDLLGISALQELRSLHLGYCEEPLTTSACKRITTLTNLEMLAVDCIRDADAALEHLTALSKLSRLSIEQASQLSISALVRLTALTALVVCAIRHWGRRNLLDFDALLHLEELDISNDIGNNRCLEPPVKVHFSYTDCFELAELTTLQSLHISRVTPINDSGFKALLSMPRLRMLHCDELDLADWQYAEYKNRYLGRIRMIAGKTEERILQSHQVFDRRTCSTQRGRETLFLRYRELLAAPPA